MEKCEEFLSFVFVINMIVDRALPPLSPRRLFSAPCLFCPSLYKKMLQQVDYENNQNPRDLFFTCVLSLSFHPVYCRMKTLYCSKKIGNHTQTKIELLKSLPLFCLLNFVLLPSAALVCERFVVFSDVVFLSFSINLDFVCECVCELPRRLLYSTSPALFLFCCFAARA